MRFAAIIRRSCSISTIPWARALASLAESACRRARPARSCPRAKSGSSKPDKNVDSLCPYCGVGCQLTYNIKDNEILYVEGRDGPANHNRLCVKGRYGFDYVHHKHRLTRPLIRKPGVPKRAD